MAPPAARLRTVYADSREQRVCPHCGGPVTWYRCYPTGARLAFDFAPAPIGREYVLDTSEAIDVLNRPPVHLCDGYQPASRGHAHAV